MRIRRDNCIYFFAIFRSVEAHEALHKLYGPNYRVTEEVEIIQENLQRQRESRDRKINYIRDLKKHPEIYKPFLIIVTLSIIQQFSGMSILRAYVVKIFNEIFQENHEVTMQNFTQFDDFGRNLTNCSEMDGFGDGSISKKAYLSAIIIGLVRLIASLLLSKLLRYYCRRAMYFTSAGLTIASLASFASCIVFIER